MAGMRVERLDHVGITRGSWRGLPGDRALGVFTSAGVVHLWVQRDPDVSNLDDLLLYSLHALEDARLGHSHRRSRAGAMWINGYRGGRAIGFR